MTVDFKKVVEQAGIPTTEQQWQDVFKKEVDAEGSLIANSSPFSSFWRLIAAIVSKPAVWLVNKVLIERILPNLFLQTATDDEFIDTKAWEHDLSRKAEKKLLGKITFHRAASNGPGLLIPAGTIVQTDPITGVVYRLLTLDDAVLEQGKLAVAVPVTAEHAGAAYNLGAGYYHVLPKAITGIGRASNDAQWIDEPGANAETNAELKQRIRNAFTASAGWHIDAVYRRLLTERSGLDADNLFFEHDAPRGPGTANVYILLDTGEPSAEMLADLNTYIMPAGFHGHGDDLQVLAMPGVSHNIGVTVYLLPTVLGSEVAPLLSGIDDFIRCAFRENSNFTATRTEPVSRFSFSKLGQELHATFPGIDSLNWHQPDIKSTMNVPRIGNLNITRGTD